MVIVSAPFKKVSKAATERLSVNSNASFNDTPSSFSCFNAGARSSRLLIGLPSACASFPDSSARLRRMLRVAVAALDASNPLFASVPNRATVSSIEKPNALATGAIVLIEFCRYSKSNADLVVATAIVLTARDISEASNPNARRAAPANCAASGISDPVAVANCRIDWVDCRISVSLKPSLASSVCIIVTCDALYSVISPNRLASAVRRLTPSCVVPNTDASDAFAASKDTMLPIPSRMVLDKAMTPLSAKPAPNVPLNTSATMLLFFPSLPICASVFASSLERRLNVSGDAALLVTSSCLRNCDARSLSCCMVI